MQTRRCKCCNFALIIFDGLSVDNFNNKKIECEGNSDIAKERLQNMPLKATKSFEKTQNT